MYKLYKYKVKIEALLGPGFYIPQNESAVGKTYLANLLNRYATYGEPVGSYGYSEFVRKMRLEDALYEGIKLFVMDRLDMYYAKLSSGSIEKLNEMSKTAIIIADLKGEEVIEGPSSLPCRLEYIDSDFIKIRGL